MDISGLSECRGFTLERHYVPFVLDLAFNACKQESEDTWV